MNFVSLFRKSFFVRLAGIAQLVEYQLPKLNVASSNLVSRYATCGRSSVVEHHVANVRVVGSNPIARFLMRLLEKSIANLLFGTILFCQRASCKTRFGNQNLVVLQEAL